MLEKPYTYLPDYADVSYVDGKLAVAQLAASKATSPSKKAEWLETIDILLSQRLALSSFEKEALQ